MLSKYVEASLCLFFMCQFGGMIEAKPAIATDPVGDIPSVGVYQPVKQPDVPIVLGERRCDNIYHGAILPCLLRPELPPFSYSTERWYNTEYKK